MNTLKKIITAFILTLTVFLISCGSPISQKNFDKIKSGMSKNEVIQLLGEPTESTGMGLGEISGANLVWKSSEITITIQFINDKVAVKSLISHDNDTTDKRS